MLCDERPDALSSKMLVTGPGKYDLCSNVILFVKRSRSCRKTQGVSHSTAPLPADRK